MTINKWQDGTTLVVAPEGRIDTATAPILEKELKESIDDSVKDLTLDFSKITYISSAGLRVLLTTNKLMLKKGSMKVTNVDSTVMEILEVTGFNEILTIE